MNDLQEKLHGEDDNIHYGDRYTEINEKIKATQHLSKEEKKQGKLIFEVLSCYGDGLADDGIMKLLFKLDVECWRHKNDDGFSPLHVATELQSVMLVEFLLKNGESDYREVVDEEGWTPLHLAAENGDPACVALLLKDSSPEYREILTECGSTALKLATSCGYTECMELLLEDSKPEYREMRLDNGGTLLHGCASNGQSDCLKLLLKDSRPEYREMLNSTGWTPLHFAAYFGHLECLQVLLNDSPPEYREIIAQEGTALHCVAIGDRCNLVESIKVLLNDSRPGYCEIRNTDGRTVAEILPKQYYNLDNDVSEDLFELLANRSSWGKLFSEEFIHEGRNSFDIVLRLLWPNQCASIMYYLDKEPSFKDDHHRFWANDIVVKTAVQWIG
eukprot:TRINITY_DN774297_c0_g1_i1.p1 TRINITY_DN774297_c0_g1~~TRINITY_DN774297_c0_g1_i1.p1  ORF type:complete len:388 (-),score=70.19 TRINITY_DN774297_c0_g1_i1:128-1291(-)